MAVSCKLIKPTEAQGDMWPDLFRPMHRAAQSLLSFWLKGRPSITETICKCCSLAL